MKFQAIVAAVSIAIGLAAPVQARNPAAPASVVAAGAEKSWTEGAKRAAKGAERVADGEADLRDAERLKREGDAQQADGTARIQTAREAYQRYLTSLSPAVDPMGVRTQIDSLADMEKRWQKALDTVADGGKKLRKSQELRTKGEARLTEGKALITEGESIKAAAEGRVVPVAVPK